MKKQAARSGRLMTRVLRRMSEMTLDMGWLEFWVSRSS